MTPKRKSAGAWSRASIQRDRERFERLHPEPAGDGDPYPPGMPPEQCGEVVPGDGWDDFEPNTWAGT